VLEKPHKKLDVWLKSINLVQNIYEITKTFPRAEDYGLTSQIRRSAVSIPANIAEGAARQTKKEFIQFLHMAQGSLSELDTHMEIALKLDYVQKISIDEISVIMNDIDKMTTGLIKSLRK